MLHTIPLASAFIFKVAELCNIDCSYCYMYHRGDNSWRLRPPVMSRDVASDALAAVMRYVERQQIDEISIAMHGGEPLLAGLDWISGFLHEASTRAADVGVEVLFAIQTNGILLDESWLAIFEPYNVRIGVSCDGPPEWHDRVRVDRSGRGTYERVSRAIELLRTHYRDRWGVLCVVDPFMDAPRLMHHFADLGVPSVDFLWPDYNHDALPPWPKGALGQFYCALFDCWYQEFEAPPRVRWFESAMSLLMGGASFIDSLGPHPITDVMVESDGTWEPLDVLRTCGDGITQTGLNVHNNEIDALWNVPLYRAGLDNQSQLAEQCTRCDMRPACGGGYLPHRYSAGQGFRNPSVHCSDIYAVLKHIRERLVEDLRRANLLAA
jgi:uncharacterized protein